MSAQGDRPRVKVVLRGFLLREGDRIVDASSTVTLVEASDQLMLVDSGSPRTGNRLTRALRTMRVSPNSISYIVNTHLHIDHCGCNDLFENARVYAHVLEDPPVGTVRISGETTLLPGVSLIPSPGHSAGSMSVLVEAEKRYAICGDAIPTRANYENHVPPFINIDARLAMMSMDALTAWAEVVIPGHDSQFEVVRKK
ncbi:MAG: MBL fold metallo-hydrolase [Thermoplasmata archaeon]